MEFLTKVEGHWFEDLDNKFKKIIVFSEKPSIRKNRDLRIIEGPWSSGYILANVDSNLKNYHKWMKRGVRSTHTSPVEIIKQTEKTRTHSNPLIGTYRP